MADTGNATPQPCPNCGTLVDVSDVEPLARVACPNCGEKFRVETAFDNFQIVETLGVGGMGSVYKARDTRLERFVALKLLRRELSADPAEAARLEQEARVTAAVNHPNVIQVYSSGSAHGQIYLVMELVDHGSLDDLMAQHTRLPERQVLEAGIQVARGLQAAHERGLIHRDVKPANILFSNKETAKIGDFGLAVAAEHKAEARHEIWGTPYYVAPERLDNVPEDFRSDIYSLGATLFHAIAGKPPMEGETTSASELRRLKSNPPSLRKVARDVSRETARVIDKTLATDPVKRFASYAEFITELERAREALEPRRSKGSSRVRWVVIAIVALLAAGEAAMLLLHKRTPPASVVASPTPTPTPDNTAALQKRYDDARMQLLNGNYDAAANAFAKLGTDAQNRHPMLEWSRLHAGLALLLQGKLPQARDTFRQIESAGPYSSAKADVPLATFFVETAKALAAPGPIRGGPELDANGPNALALFLDGIKDWQLREFDEAAGLLRRFVEADVPNEFKWFADYKPIARKHLDDHAAYTESKALPPRLADSGEARSALEKVRALQHRAQTRGALVEALKEEGKRLSTRASALEKEEKDALYRKAVEDFEKKKPELLAQWKSDLISDLNSGGFDQPIKVGAAEFKGAKSADDAGITLNIAGLSGTQKFKWETFTPEALLQMSKIAMRRADQSVLADRKWHAAVYGQSTGQTEAAKQLAEEAAKAKPEYREQTRLLIREQR
ncbi:MAG: protein kinase [Verrucomicrobiota bacterium]|nr:protein kinase [Verrucomicrobiota bacterium]